MQVKVQKVGNSLMLVIPRLICERFKIRKGLRFDVMGYEVHDELILLFSRNRIKIAGVNDKQMRFSIQGTSDDALGTLDIPLLYPIYHTEKNNLSADNKGKKGRR